MQMGPHVEATVHRVKRRRTLARQEVVRAEMALGGPEGVSSRSSQSEHASISLATTHRERIRSQGFGIIIYTYDLPNVIVRGSLIKSAGHMRRDL